MAKHLRLDFSVTGFQDGPVSARLLAEGRSPEWMAQYFADELRQLLLRELGNDADISKHVRVECDARLHDTEEGTGHAETSTDDS